MSSPEAIRQRRKDGTSPPGPATEPKTSEKEEATPTLSLADRVKAEDSAFSFVDVARILVFLLLASSALSYFVTRESFTWNLKRPGWTRVETIKTWIAGPLSLTDADLAAYDGTDPTKPIYLAINGTIYDVSLGRRHYGPDGSYHFFSGKDASRAFVTNCFLEDGNPDLRGVEQMFLPLDDYDVDSLYTKSELKIMREKERRIARTKVHDALKHWVDFFEKSDKYPRVGRVKREKGWMEKGEVKKLCKKAQAGRVKRPIPPGKQI
ncbi:uncharacterized protein L3040_003981 [Drepanopeziza brunnea f. sp. 'multigermtubi']|uniref:Cytochrome b5-like Heme/Steroid binding domain-containing protein n=1 Tax=Marssonina brunnea f. sp. multigermtubi (strain MB_m1) TaxID=1072389 RepID=K1WBR1_MARBU|nr:cytochrome b5-like Heme/Steroid binding domain-containing protein [Drepanopeziza brunnea f. sp. 'multigermtubi' MB_m1]EKD14800.1 cytochrome b5-like Heme/Steroid binding domain-containing protein [Drepanopeziza brunnea f. sp. 'multigermtubi' MB_m1]KAJ5046751.1 hypothetical protein L3040_003981 [Drepanopeziza brunnea f. sp. 'multigermtubi']